MILKYQKNETWKYAEGFETIQRGVYFQQEGDQTDADAVAYIALQHDWDASHIKYDDTTGLTHRQGRTNGLRTGINIIGLEYKDHLLVVFTDNDCYLMNDGGRTIETFKLPVPLERIVNGKPEAI